MVDRLDDACYLSNDPPDASPIPVISQSSNGKRGRPRKNIDSNFLAEAMRIRQPSGIAPVLQCHPRTVRRHALDLGLVEPGQPVFLHRTLADGSHVRARNTAPRRTRSTLTDVELDAAIGQILEIFPAFGRNLIAGRLKASGHEVTRERIIASYLRVHGAPGAFGDRSIHRKAYKVAGANSLWHHDGQHGSVLDLPSCLLLMFSLGLIRFKIVIHCFIDGKSRFVTGIHVVSNNRSATVRDLFLKAIQQHGVPSRVRGDHGTENVLVAAWMEEFRGPGRGSYIWGRCVICHCSLLNLFHISQERPQHPH